MSEYLPCGRLNWLKNIDKFDIMSIRDKSPIGYFLEVNIKYPAELHKLNNNFLLAPQNLAVSFLGICCQNIVKNCWWIWNKSWWCKKN